MTIELLLLQAPPALPEQPLIDAVARQGSFALAAALLSYTMFAMRHSIGKAIEAWAARRRARAAGIALEELNGKLALEIGKAIAPLMEQAIDQRFEEMPEKLATRIKALAQHAVRNALNEFLMTHGAKLEAVATLSAQLHELTKDVAEVRESLARVEGAIEARAKRRGE